MSISKIKENAKVALNGKWGVGIGMFFAYLLVSFVTGFVTGLVRENSLLGTLLQLATLIIEVPISLGLSYSFIKLKRNETIGAFDFLNLGFSNFARSWKIALRTVLKLILPIIGIIVSLGLIAGAGVYSVFLTATASGIGTSTLATMGLVLAGLILYIVSLIWLMIRSFLYSLTAYVAYDNPNSNSLEVVNESARLMNGKRWKLFVLELSFIVWYLIPIVLIGIKLALPGLLAMLGLYIWLFPYMQVAFVCFYDELAGKNSNNNSEEQPQNNEEVNTEM